MKKPVWLFQFINLKQEATPIVMPLSSWHQAANDTKENIMRL